MSSTTPSAPDQPDPWLSAQLRALPDPPMPSDVYDAVMAAVRAEQAAPNAAAATAAGEGHAAAATDVPRAPVRRRGWLIGLAAAAATVVGIAVVSNSLSDSPGDYESVVALSSVQPVSTNARYTPENIEQSVVSHLRALETRTASLRPAADAVRRGSFAANDEVMASCLQGVGAAPSNLRMVDLADYQGQPSGILVFNDSGGNLIVVVAPRCAAEDPRVRLRLNAPQQ